MMVGKGGGGKFEILRSHLMYKLSETIKFSSPPFFLRWLALSAQMASSRR
jgi:hypothetical protein